jgi:hypothetical protein
MLGVLTLLATLLFGSFAGGASDVGESASIAAPPSSPAPSVWRGVGPPPAWVETERGSFWLGYNGYCWKALCIKGGPTGRGELPPVVVRRGEVVRFHLGFRPRRVSLSMSRGAPRRLEPARTMSWRVERGGFVSLLAYTARGEPAGSSAGYFAVFKLG